MCSSVKALALLLLAGASGLACMQQARAEVIETVVVTAEKRSQDVMDVPGTIIAIGSDKIQAQGLRTAEDLTSVVPGLSYYTLGGQDFFAIRGAGTPVDNGWANDSVTISVDGVVIPRPSEATLDDNDVQRIEVLSGPQGTLYGRNTTGGAVNFISALPSDTFIAQAGVLAGSYDTWGFHGFISGPLTDHVRFRLSVSHKENDEGYVKDVYTGGTVDKLSRWNVRAALSAEVAPDVTVDLAAQYTWDHYKDYAALFATFPMPAATPVSSFGKLTPGPIGAGHPYSMLQGTDYSLEPWQTGSDYTPWSNRKTLLLTSNIAWNLTDKVALKSVTGYIMHSMIDGFDADGTSFSYAVEGGEGSDKPRKLNDHTFSQEFDLTGTFGVKGGWVVGAYYAVEGSPQYNTVEIPSTLSAVFVPNLGVRSSAIIDTRTGAIFGDVTVPITDRLRVFGGARESWDSVKTKMMQAFVNPIGIFNDSFYKIFGFASNPSVVDCFGTPFQGTEPVFRQSWAAFTPRAGVQYDAAEDVVTYFQYQKGFKDGGANGSSCGNLFKPEENTAYELGMKARFFGGSLVTNVSLYDNDYTNMQIYRRVGSSSLVDNADARILGIDFSAQARPVDFLGLDVSGSILDARFTRYCSADPINPAGNNTICADTGKAGQDLVGKRVVNAPPYSIVAGADLDLPVDWYWFDRLTFRGEAHFVGETKLAPYAAPDPVQPAYVLGNLYATLASSTEGLRLTGYVRNVGDTPVMSHFLIGGENVFLGTYLEPRTIGFELKKSFN